MFFRRNAVDVILIFFVLKVAYKCVIRECQCCLLNDHLFNLLLFRLIFFMPLKKIENEIYWVRILSLVWV